MLLLPSVVFREFVVERNPENVVHLLAVNAALPL